MADAPLDAVRAAAYELGDISRLISLVSSIFVAKPVVDGSAPAVDLVGLVSSHRYLHAKKGHHSPPTSEMHHKYVPWPAKCKHYM